MRHKIYILFLSALFSVKAFPQVANEADTGSFYSMSLEQLMNVRVAVTSALPTASRESSGIVTVITSDEIKNTGAQDLMQVLQQVPGFDFGVDVEGVIGIGVRGNWAHEGKALLLWDGLEMNEDLYATLQFVHHYPIDRIKKIEIIRGPGSARYGSTAEYAVINVITYNDSEFNGVCANITNTWMSKTFGSRNSSVAIGKSIGEAHVNISAQLGQANQSQDVYTDYKGNSYSMAKQSGIDNSEYRMDLFYKGLSVTGLKNNYSIQQRDSYEEICNRVYTVGFNTTQLAAKYDIKNKNGLIITPGIKIKYQEPWKYKDQIINDFLKPFHTSVGKKEYYVNTYYDFRDKVDFEAGVQYYNVIGKDLLDSGYFSNGSKELTIDNYSGFFQSTVKTSLCNVIVGTRYNYNPYYPSSFVPRFGLTKVFENMHFKALYSRAFRAPSIENINSGKNIKPERTSVLEFEAGCKITASAYLTANIFKIHTDDPIVYGYDMDLNEYYFNDSRTGTKGIEIDYKQKFSGFFASINYSYYKLLNNHSPNSIYSIPGNSEQALAFPSHKVNFNINVALSKRINFNVTESYISERFSVSKDDMDIFTITRYHPSFYSGAAVNLENVFVKGLRFQLSCLNITDEKIYYIQPYNGNHEALPGASREIQVRLTYSL